MTPDGTVRIVHLSDPHFGAKGDMAAWDSVVSYLSGDDVKPELVLVTGDLVDTPKPSLFSKARSALEDLNEKLGWKVGEDKKYLVCPGNHDRHVKGNAFPWRRPKPHFDAAKFQFPGLHAPYTVSIGNEPLPWRVRVVSLDSSIRARYSAQAFLDPRELENLKAFRDRRDAGEPPNLVILLIHHHLLPLPASEATTQSMWDLIRPTSAVNPGTILEHLAESLVDVVIHGHEHQRNLAGYVSYRRGAGKVAVVAAGSATGMQTLHGCDVKRASFNILELRPDRSVWTSEVKWKEGKEGAPGSWCVSQGSTVQLLDSTTLRHNRFMRLSHLLRVDNGAGTTQAALTDQNGDDSIEPTELDKTSEWHKHIIITEQRDAIVTEKRSGWKIEKGAFGFAVQNDTGQPAFPKASLQLDLAEDQSSIRATNPQFDAIKGKPGSYQFRLELDRTEPIVAASIETSYSWLDAIILTQSDFALIETKFSKSFRSSKKEFVAATVPIPLHNLTLTVTFPVGYYPLRSEVSVYTQKRSESEGDPLRDEALEKRLQFTGQTILLNVPYPLMDYRYCIVWNPVAAKRPTEAAIKFRTEVQNEKSEFAKKFMQALHREVWAAFATVAIYVPMDDPEVADFMLVRAEFVRAAKVPTDSDPPPQKVNLRDSEGLYRHAWWGETGIAVAENDAKGATAEGMLNDEVVAVWLPIKGLGATEIVPWGILRLGILQESSKENWRNSAVVEAFERVLDLAHISMLYDLRPATE